VDLSSDLYVLFVWADGWTGWTVGRCVHGNKSDNIFVYELFSVSEGDYFCGYGEDQKNQLDTIRAAQRSRHRHVPVN
jgi:hypothetical protein